MIYIIIYIIINEKTYIIYFFCLLGNNFEDKYIFNWGCGKYKKNFDQYYICIFKNKYKKIELNLYFSRKRTIRSNSLRRNLYDPFPPPFNVILSFCLEKFSKKSVFSVRMPTYILGNNIDQRNMGGSGLMESIWGDQVWWNHMQEDNWFWKNIFMKRWYNSLNNFKIFSITK